MARTTIRTHHHNMRTAEGERACANCGRVSRMAAGQTTCCTLADVLARLNMTLEEAKGER